MKRRYIISLAILIIAVVTIGVVSAFRNDSLRKEPIGNNLMKSGSEKNIEGNGFHKCDGTCTRDTNSGTNFVDADSDGVCDNYAKHHGRN
jgi:hypothetical protein